MHRSLSALCAPSSLETSWYWIVRRIGPGGVHGEGEEKQAPRLPPVFVSLSRKGLKRRSVGCRRIEASCARFRRRIRNAERRYEWRRKSRDAWMSDRMARLARFPTFHRRTSWILHSRVFEVAGIRDLATGFRGLETLQTSIHATRDRASLQRAWSRPATRNRTFVRGRRPTTHESPRSSPVLIESILLRMLPSAMLRVSEQMLRRFVPPRLRSKIRALVNPGTKDEHNRRMTRSPSKVKWMGLGIPSTSESKPEASFENASVPNAWMNVHGWILLFFF